MTDRPSHTNQQINSIVIDEEQFDPIFIYHRLRSMTPQFKARATGAATPILNKSSFSAIEIEVPDTTYQRRAGTILKAYDDLIEVNRRRIALLEEIARGLFEEWFVRFRFPGLETIAINDTAEGRLPEGWTRPELGQAIELAYGKALKTDDRVDGTVPVFGSSGIVGSHNEALVIGPGIVVGRKGNVGSVIWTDEDFWPIDTTFFVRSDLPLTYVYEALRRMPFQNAHAAVPGLSRDAALKLRFVVPPNEMLQQFHEFAQPLRSQLEVLSRSNARVARIRDQILTRLVTGQLKLATAEEQAADAATQTELVAAE